MSATGRNLIGDALGAGPDEDLGDAADRIMAYPHDDPRWRIAAVVLDNDLTDAVLRRAAKVARRIGGRS